MYRNCKFLKLFYKKTFIFEKQSYNKKNRAASNNNSFQEYSKFS